MNLAELALLENRDVSQPLHPVYDQLPALEKVSAGRAASRLALCGNMGLYNPDSPKRLVDFGAGRGGSTFALALLAEQNNGSVDALEVNAGRISEMAAAGLGEQMPVRTHQVEGINWLYECARRGERFDLITGAMFGPDFSGNLARMLLLVSRGALEPGGSMIIYSDPFTMEAAQKVCEEEGADFRGLETLNPVPGLSALPDTIVVTNS